MNPSHVIELTQRLVRIPSVLSNEHRVNQVVHQELQDLGFDDVSIDDWGNCIGVKRGERSGPTLLFDAHVDTVGTAPEHHWSRGPFSAEIDQNRIYGRGTSDMKGALAAMICGVAKLARHDIAGTIVISASVGEELVEGAALAQVMEKHPADFVVVGEASSLDIVNAGRGRAEFGVQVTGQPAHASRPDLGVNAVHLMSRVNQAFEDVPIPSHEIGTGVLCLTDIISDPYPAHSVVPSGCRTTWERRLVPGERREDVLEQHRRTARHALRDLKASVEIELATTNYTTPTGITVQQEKWFPAWQLDCQHPLVVSALGALQSIGQDPGLRTYQFCTNAALSAGVMSLPTIGYGPSSEELAHMVDEYIEIEQLVAAAQGYRAIAGAVLAP